MLAEEILRGSFKENSTVTLELLEDSKDDSGKRLCVSPKENKA